MFKSIFILWSAGIDSTYLILRLLNEGYKVSAAYVHIENNKVKTKMELRAISIMNEQIKKIFPFFDYQGVILKSHNLSTNSAGIKYRQVPYFMHALLLAPPTDFRALAYVSGDSSIKSLEKIRNLYNSYSNITYGKFPQLVFPLKNISKASIIYYMKKYYPDIFNNCVWCSKPNKTIDDNLISCNKCVPCKRFNNEIKSLNTNKILI